jgi:hypothetical protein
MWGISGDVRIEFVWGGNDVGFVKRKRIRAGEMRGEGQVENKES